MIKILGICGSPVKNSNTERILREALETIQREDVRTKVVTLHGKDIQDCIHCNWCLLKQEEGKFCSIEDHMAEIYPEVLEADGLMLATPVYIGRLSGRMAALLDRMRALDYGKRVTKALKHKTGAGIAVSWYRNSGIETTLMTLHWAFMTWQMIIATPGSLATFGGGGVTSLGGTGEFDPKDKHQVLKDVFGMETAKATAASLLELTDIVKRGRASIG